MRILHAIPSAAPQSGGPIEGVRQLARAASAFGHVTDVVSLDGPIHSSPDSGIHQLFAVGPGLGLYGFTRRLDRWLRVHVSEYDVLIIDGLWQYSGLAASRAAIKAGIPYCVFSHGMMDPWFSAESPLKALKKRLYWSVAEGRVLAEAKYVLFTTEEELTQARCSFFGHRANSCVTPFGIHAPKAISEKELAAFIKKYPECSHNFLCFLGRLHPKKGCELLLKAFAKAHSMAGDVRLIMAGPADPDYLGDLMSLASQLGIEGLVSWPGMLVDSEKWALLTLADAFSLPSHQENFGIAVVEAMSMGLPTLISNRVNIWESAQAAGASIVGDDTLEGTEQCLRTWWGLSAESQSTMRQNSLDCFDANFNIGLRISGYLSILEAACQPQQEQSP